MPVRTVLLVAVAVLVVPSALLLNDLAGPVGISAAVVAGAALAAIVGGKPRRATVHVLALAASGVSLGTTGYVLLSDTAIRAPGTNLGPVEVAGLFVLLAAVAAWTRPLRPAVACGAVVWIACLVWILRLTAYWPPADPAVGPWPVSSGYDLLIVAGHFAVMAFPATIAAVIGAAPRYLAHRRRELIASIRGEQRLELAQDLHDYVAHDLTGIVAQAQSARFARADDVEHLRGALERIEQVGVNALDTMDGFIKVLHDEEPWPLSLRRIADIPALVDRFRADRGFETSVRIEPEDVSDGVPRELQATAYRVVVEGLTNVHRHAVAGCPVTVSVSGGPDGALSVIVRNDTDAAEPVSRRRARGGTGLTALRERVAAVGGRLEAGPDGDGAWRLSATLPYSRNGGSRS